MIKELLIHIGCAVIWALAFMLFVIAMIFTDDAKLCAERTGKPYTECFNEVG